MNNLYPACQLLEKLTQYFPPVTLTHHALLFIDHKPYIQLSLHERRFPLILNDEMYLDIEEILQLIVDYMKNQFNIDPVLNHEE